jgi:hypothetical protein
MLAQRFFVSPVNSKVVLPPSLREAVPITGDQISRILPSDWAWANRNAVEIDARWTRILD